jgi:hypothetical protein
MRYSPRSGFSSCALRGSGCVSANRPLACSYSHAICQEDRVPPPRREPFQHGIHRRAGHVQVASNGRNTPADAACKWITARRRSSGSVISSARGNCRVVREGRGPSAKTAFTVCLLGRRPLNWIAQILAISPRVKSGYSALRSTISWRIGTGSDR